MHVWLTAAKETKVLYLATPPVGGALRLVKCAGRFDAVVGIRRRSQGLSAVMAYPILGGWEEDGRSQGLSAAMAYPILGR